MPSAKIMEKKLNEDNVIFIKWITHFFIKFIFSTSTVVKVGYNLPLQQCTDGYFKDDNGNCLKGITKKEKEFE